MLFFSMKSSSLSTFLLLYHEFLHYTSAWFGFEWESRKHWIKREQHNRCNSFLWNRAMHDEIQTSLDEIKVLRLQWNWIRLLSLRSKISSQSDFICEADLFRRKTDLVEKSVLKISVRFFLEEPNGLDATVDSIYEAALIHNSWFIAMQYR